MATGGGSGIELMFSDRSTSDGTTLIVGFGLAERAPDFHNEREVRAAVERFFPEAEYIAHDWHDWVSDRHALGTWVGVPLGAETGLDAESWERFDRIAFATSDLAHEQAGWFEGAIASGERAAEAIEATLASA